MILKILDLNIWNYNKWDERKSKIVKFIKKENPDIVVFQEVRDDVQFNKKGDNQAKQLNKLLKYPYVIFSPATDKRKERPEKYKRFCVEGQAILSRFPIVFTKNIKLKKQRGDKYYCSNLHGKIKLEKEIDLINLQFSPNDVFSLNQLKETLAYIRKKNINPIIVGDFNIRHSSWLDKLTKKDYNNSFKYKKYISHPAAKYTLDYILIPKDLSFKSFRCGGKDLSDHRALIAEVKL